MESGRNGRKHEVRKHANYSESRPQWSPAGTAGSTGELPVLTPEALAPAMESGRNGRKHARPHGRETPIDPRPQWSPAGTAGSTAPEIWRV